MNAEQTRQLLRVHRDCGVPLLDSVELLLRVRDLLPSGFAQAAGQNGTHLRQALAGEMLPSPELRAAMVRFLSVDPWGVYRTWSIYRPPPALDAVKSSDGAGDRFLCWVAEGLRAGRIEYNSAKARVHVVPEGVLLASPAIFQDYAMVNGEPWKAAQKRFQRLGRHIRTTVGGNIHRYAVAKTGRLIHGHLLPDGRTLFGPIRLHPIPCCTGARWRARPVPDPNPTSKRKPHVR
jgi:hypothetical protein